MESLDMEPIRTEIILLLYQKQQKNDTERVSPLFVKCSAFFLIRTVNFASSGFCVLLYMICCLLGQVGGFVQNSRRCFC